MEHFTTTAPMYLTLKQGHKNDASKNKPGYLQLYHRCIWIVVECGFNVKLLIRFLWDCSWLLQIQSHIISCLIANCLHGKAAVFILLK